MHSTDTSIKYISCHDTLLFLFFAPTVPDVSTKLFVNYDDSLYAKIYPDDSIRCLYYTIKDPNNTPGWYDFSFTMKFFDRYNGNVVKKTNQDTLRFE